MKVRWIEEIFWIRKSQTGARCREIQIEPHNLSDLILLVFARTWARHVRLIRYVLPELWEFPAISSKLDSDWSNNGWGICQRQPSVHSRHPYLLSDVPLWVNEGHIWRMLSGYFRYFWQGWCGYCCCASLFARFNCDTTVTARNTCPCRKTDGHEWRGMWVYDQGGPER